MSSLIKVLALLIAIVGLAVTSFASLVTGESSEHIPGSLSELGDFDSLDWVQVLRSKCKNRYCAPDHAFELLKKLDKIYEALDDEAKIKRNELKIVEQFEINQIDVDQFCTGENLQELTDLSYCFHRIFLREHDRTITEYRRSVGNYLKERKRNFAFVCRSYVLKSLNKRVGDLNETDRHDMELTLGSKLLLLAESNESLVEFLPVPEMKRNILKINPKWMDILLEFLKEKSGNKLDAKCYITTGEEGWEKFKKLFKDSVVDMCWRWIDAIREAERFQQHDERQAEYYTEKQASWMKYADVCLDIIFDRKLLAESLYSKLKGE